MVIMFWSGGGFWCPHVVTGDDGRPSGPAQHRGREMSGQNTSAFRVGFLNQRQSDTERTGSSQGFSSKYNSRRVMETRGGSDNRFHPEFSSNASQFFTYVIPSQITELKRVKYCDK